MPHVRFGACSFWETFVYFTRIHRFHWKCGKRMHLCTYKCCKVATCIERSRWSFPFTGTSASREHRNIMQLCTRCGPAPLFCLLSSHQIKLALYQTARWTPPCSKAKVSTYDNSSLKGRLYQSRLQKWIWIICWKDNEQVWIEYTRTISGYTRSLRPSYEPAAYFPPNQVSS